MPKISVIISTYNRDLYVRKAIKSVLAQTFKDFEIIVVDDGSVDLTKEVVKKFKKKVRYIYQKNRGPSSARNTGIRHAKGKYIAFLDSDDRFLKNKLQRQMDYLNRNPKCKFLYTWYYNVNNQGKTLKLRKSRFSSDREELKFLLFAKKFSIRTSTVIINKKCFEKSGVFNEKYWYSQDWDMWLRLSKYYKAHCLQKPLAKYLIHKENRSNKKVDKYHAKIRKNALKLFGWNRQKLKELKKKYAEK